MSKNGQPLVRPVAKAILCAALLTSLSGCVEMMVGGAVMGAVATADRRTLGAQTEDKTITVKAELRVPKIAGPDAHVNIASFNRRVLLTGEVRDEAAKAGVEREVRSIEGVQTIDNELEIAGPSSYTSRSSDALITTKVKASLVDAKDLFAGAFKVVTERGTVFLMGRVTQQEADRATAIARQIDGVQRVVRIFEVIGEDEMRRIQTQLAPTAPISARP